MLQQYLAAGFALRKKLTQCVDGGMLQEQQHPWHGGPCLQAGIQQLLLPLPALLIGHQLVSEIVQVTIWLSLAAEPDPICSSLMGTTETWTSFELGAVQAGHSSRRLT